MVLFDIFVNILTHNLAEPAYEADVAQLEYKLVAGEHGLIIRRWNNKWHIYPSALNWTKYVIQQFSGIHTKRQHRIVLAGRRKTDTVGSTQQVPACCPVVVYRMQHREEDPPPQKSPAVQISSRRKLTEFQRVTERYT